MSTNQMQEAQLNQALETALAAHQRGSLEEAKTGYLQVLSQVDNEPAGIMHLLGLVHHQLGEFQAAEPLFEKIVAKAPENPTYHFNLGLLKMDLNQPQAACTSLKQATQLQPEYAEALEALATVYKDTQQPEQSFGLYQRLNTMQPQEPKWHKALADLHEAQNRIEKALPHWEAILELNPKLEAEEKEAILFKAGKFHYDNGRLEEAAQVFKSLLSFNKQHNQGLLYLAQTLSTLGKANEARTYFQALFIKSLMPGFRLRRLFSLPVVYQNEAELQEWQGKIEQDLEDLKSQPIQIQNPVSEIGSTPFYTAYHGMSEKALMCDLGDMLTKSLPIIKRTLRKLAPTQRPKVAVVSRFLHSQHTIKRVFESLICGLSPEQFDIIECPILNFGQTEAPRALHPKHQVLPLSIGDYWGSCDKLMRQNADIILYTDLGMEPMSTYMACHRLAPVQCVLWGHPVTSGMPEIDYYISHKTMEPALESAQANYREKLLLTEHIMATFQVGVTPKGQSQKADFGFKAEDHLYVCPQTLYKFHPSFDDSIEAILSQDEQGQLVVFNGKHSTWTEQLKSRFNARFGSNPSLLERIHFLNEMPHAQFLAFLSVCDVMLDTPVFGGGCTSLDALFVGLPVVTLDGDCLKQKMTAGFYRQMGKTDLIATTPEAFVAKALELGKTPEAQAHCKQEILAKCGALFDNRAVGELATLLRSFVPQPEA